MLKLAPLWRTADDYFGFTAVDLKGDPANNIHSEALSIYFFTINPYAAT